MKRLTKALSLLTAVAMISSAGLTGCGKKGATSGDKSGKVEEKPVVLKLAIQGNKPGDFDLVQAEWNKYLKEKVGAELTFEFLAWDTHKQKLTSMLATNETLDMACTASWLGYYEHVAKGAFAELDGLIETYGQDMKKQINPLYLEGPRVDGKLYMLPTNKEIAEAHAQWFRTDLLKKYNLTVTKDMTIEDFEPLFKTIKEKEPGISPMYAVDWYGVTKGQVENYEKFDNVPGYEYLYIEHATGKVQSMFDLDWAVEKYKIFRDYKLKKYGERTPPDKISQQGDAVKAGKVFSWGEMMKPGEAEVIMRGNNLTELPTPASALKAKINTQTSTGAGVAIVKYSKNKEKAMQVMNLLWSDQRLINLVQSGIENKHYVKVKDVEFHKKLPDGIKSPGDTKYDTSGFSWLFGDNLKYLIWDNEPADKHEQYRKFNAEAYTSPLLGFYFSPEKVKTQIASIDNTWETNKKILNAGMADVDETLTKLKKKLADSGMDKVIAECQAQYDNWKKNYKK